MADVVRFLPRIRPVPAEALGAFHMSIGVFILAGGALRFSGPGWAGARILAPWWVWGLILTLAGAFVLWCWPWLESCHPRTSVLVIACGSMPLMFLTIGFVYAAKQSPVVGLTGIGAYGSIVFAHLHLAVHMIRDGVLDRRGCK